MKYFSFQSSYKSVLSFALFILLTTSSIPLLSQTKSFSGAWRTSFGKLTMAVNGGSVSGVYQAGANAGKVSGRLSGDGTLLTGRWSLEGKSGRLIFRLVPGKNGFVGDWWEGQQQPKGKWIGVRMGGGQTAGTINVADYQGSFHSNYGKMTFQVTDNRVTGTFTGAKNQGTFNGTIDPRTNKLVANWKDANTSGRMILKMLKGENSFNGEWWYADNEYGGFWYGSRALAVEGCISGDCNDGRGQYIWADGSRYGGGWQGNQYQGSGYQFNPRGGLVNKGIWVKGIYRGKVLSGNCIDGNGKIALVDGSTYEGTFAGGMPQGEGIFVYENGDRFTGGVQNGLPHGEGTYEWAENGDKLNGNFRRGKIRGKATYTFVNGDQYTGIFRRGKREGAGKMVWQNGDSYEGLWKNGLMQGKGSYQYKDGDKYTGNFNQGLKSGEGTYTFANGNAFTAVWKEDGVDEYDSAESGYAGIAEGSGNLSLPLILKNAHPGDARITNLEARPLVYVISKSHKVSGKETILDYYIVYGDRNQPAPDEEEIAALVSEKSGKDVSGIYQVDKVSNPFTRIKQIMSRQGIGSDARVSSIYRGTYFITE